TRHSSDACGKRRLATTQPRQSGMISSSTSLITVLPFRRGEARRKDSTVGIHVRITPCLGALCAMVVGLGWEPPDFGYLQVEIRRPLWFGVIAVSAGHRFSRSARGSAHALACEHVSPRERRRRNSPLLATLNIAECW